MIKLKLSLDLAPLDEVQAFARNLPKTVKEVGKPIAREIKNPLLDELRKYPRGPKYAYGKFPWKSKAQRRAVMAKLGGKRYKRSYGLRKGWKVLFTPSANGFVMSVSNDADSAMFVVGKLNQRSRADAVLPIQPFHADRWTPAVDIVAPYFAKADAMFTESITQRFDGALKVKATRRSRFR